MVSTGTRRRVERAVLTGAWVLGLTVLALGGQAWAQRPEAGTGGQGMYAVAVAPEEGDGQLSWFLPIMLNRLLAQAQIGTLSTEELAAAVKDKGVDLASGLPKIWNAGQIRAAAQKVGGEQGYVLVASWHTDAAEKDCTDETPFWLAAKLWQGDKPVFEVQRLQREGGKPYRLAEYSEALQQLAEMVVANVKGEQLSSAKGSDVWKQRVTLEQVRWLAEAEQDIAAGTVSKLEEALEALRKAQAEGGAGALVAAQRLLEVDELLRKLDPAAGLRAADRAGDEASKRIAARAKDDAQDHLAVAERSRFHEKWEEAAPEYFLWVQYLVDAKLLQPAELYPEVVRPELDSRRPRVWDKLTSAGLEAEWWGTVALSLYRGGFGGLAPLFATYSEERVSPAAETDAKARADALCVLAKQAGLRSDYGAEERLYGLALKVREGPPQDVRGCANIYVELGWMYDTRGDPAKEREMLEKRALPLFGGASPGAPDLDYARLCDGLYAVYDDLGDLDLAMEWCQKALDIREKLVPESVDCATSYLHVGVIWHRKGDYGRAQEWDRKALALYERLLPGSERCAGACNNLGGEYSDAGDPDHALEWYEKSLAIYEQLAPGSLDCARVYGNLGVVHGNKHDLLGALEWFGKAVAIGERLAPGSLNCALVYKQVGRAYAAAGDQDSALEWYQKAVAICEKMIPGTASCAYRYWDVGRAYADQGDKDRALEWYQKALVIYEKVAQGTTVWADVHIDVGLVWEDKGEHDRALEGYQQALAIYEKVAPGTQGCALVYNNIGGVYEDKGDVDRALEWYKKAMAIYEKVAPDTADCARTCRNLGLVYERKGDLASTVEWRKKLLAVLEKTDPKSDECATVSSTIGFCLLRMDKAEEALPYLRAAVDKESDADAEMNLALGYIALNQLDEALDVINKLSARDVWELRALVSGDDEAYAAHLLKGGNPSAYYVLGRVWEACSRRETMLPGKGSEYRIADVAVAPLDGRGEAKIAMHAYETFLKNAKPNHPWRHDAEARMRKLKGGA